MTSDPNGSDMAGSWDDVFESMCINRRTLEVVDLSRSDDEAAFWHGRTGEERLAALEQLRKVFYGYDETAKGLQRILVVAELDGS